MPHHYKSRIFQFTLILLGASLLAQQPRNINAADLISFPTIRNLDINLMSNVIIYELRETHFDENAKRQHLWMMDVDGNNNKQLTYSAKNEWGPKISPNGQSVAFFSDRADRSGETATRLWMLPLTGGEAFPVSDSNHSISQFKWGKNEMIYYLCPQSKPAATKTWEEQKNAQGFDANDRTAPRPNMEIWSLNTLTLEKRRVFVGNPGVSSFDVDASGGYLVYGTNYTGDDNDWLETDIYLFSLTDSTQIRQLTNFKGPEDKPRFSPDGRTVAYLRPQDSKKPFSQIEIETVDLVSAKVERLTKDLNLTLSEFFWYTNNSILAEVSQGLNNVIYQISRDGRFSSISGGSAFFHKCSSPEGSPLIAAVRHTPTGLGEIVVTMGPGRTWKQLTHLSDALEGIQIHPQTTFRWRSRDERFNLEGLVVVPQFSGTEPLPLIVDIHGGPAARTDISLEQYPLYQAWASQGFAVFSPNFRGSEGYGANFQIDNYRDLGGGDYHDIMTGVQALINRGVAHPDSLVIMGGSYGGYMTNWVITQTDRFKVAVSRYGIYDLRSDFSNSIYAQWELDYLGKTYWDEPNIYRRLSPSTFIQNAKTPNLFLHGADDENTFTANSIALARALKTLNVPHRFFLYPREGHGMGEPNHRLDVFNRQLSWINHHLKRDQALSGEDWLDQDIRVQVLDLQREVEFHNRPNETFLSVKLLIDGTYLTTSQYYKLSDISLEPGNHHCVGLPSGEFLAPTEEFKIEVGNDLAPLELELVFPASKASKLILQIRGVGDYLLPAE